jgi:hypothetical protein
MAVFAAMVIPWLSNLGFIGAVAREHIMTLVEVVSGNRVFWKTISSSARESDRSSPQWILSSLSRTRDAHVWMSAGRPNSPDLAYF